MGTKVYLRPVEREDAAQFQPWFNDPEVTRYLLVHRPLSRKMEEDFIDKMAGSEQDMILAVVVRGCDRLVGVTGFHQINPKNRSACFGITIGDKSAWGKGYATEATALMAGYAFEALNLNRVWLHVFEYNPRGIRAYERVGFRREGVLRRGQYREGRYWDTVVMAILREDWDALRAGMK
jgi:RimJ/RimL family protein N-acetyltransferase